MTTKLEQAARQALEALEMYNEHGAILRPLVTTQALREALQELENKLAEQAEQEPVAYVYEKDVAGIGMRKDVAFTKHVEVGTDLYAAPVRTKDLTVEELNTLWDNAKGGWVGLFRAIIAADREKNK